MVMVFISSPMRRIVGNVGFFGAEFDVVIEQKHALEGGLAIDQDGSDLAVSLPSAGCEWLRHRRL